MNAQAAWETVVPGAHEVFFSQQSAGREDGRLLVSLHRSPRSSAQRRLIGNSVVSPDRHGPVSSSGSPGFRQSPPSARSYGGPSEVWSADPIECCVSRMAVVGRYRCPGTLVRCRAGPAEISDRPVALSKRGVPVNPNLVDRGPPVARRPLPSKTGEVSTKAAPGPD
jgi:hypothetical protein